MKVLLLAVMVFAIVLTAGMSLYKWYFAVPTIPLADAVRAFNTRYAEDPVGKYEPPVTEAEVIAAIRAQLPTLQASQQVIAAYSNIARIRRIPQDASLHAITGWELKDGTEFTVWWINLDVTTGKNSGYGLRIRENNAPIAKPKDEPKLELSNRMWIPKSSKAPPAAP
ncbi:MAG TPA: hypothetical protein VHK01_10615 [Lacipirellulaceae bacterium]|nr:hypothetical protein [Lacipirellulaceae bacterium]